MKTYISASVMCADMTHLQRDLSALEAAGVDWIHCDVMDGSFVPNITLGFDLVNAIKQATTLPVDVHMMVSQPERYLDRLSLGASDFLTLHAEATVHLERALSAIHKRGIHAGVALNPQTSIESVADILDLADLVTVMTVSPGFAGQVMFEGAPRKVRKVRAFLDENGLKHVPIEVDGNINLPNVRMLRACGASVFVAGSSGLFIPGRPLADTARELRTAMAP